jgi:AcrR family transcriptional regulator
MSYIQERRAEEKDRRRQEIVDAAERVFASVGFDAATMDQVARQARLSRALLYVYFKDKMELHFGVCERALNFLRQRFSEAASRHVRGLDQVQAIGRAYIGFAQEMPHYFSALARFESHRLEDIAEGNAEIDCMRAGDSVHQVIVDALNVGIKDGSVRSDVGDPYLVSVTLWGFMHGTIQLSSTKAEALAAHGVSVNLLIENAVRMAGRAVASTAT